jgi:MFS family permease
LLAALARGGLMFIPIIWLQGIWLPEHGYSFSQTPLWAGIYMLPLTAGFLIAGPVSGMLADRYGARPFATAGLLVAGLTFASLEVLPVDFPFWGFAAVLLVSELGMGMFGAPNLMGIMNSLPADQRGVGAGMTMTVTSSAQVLSIGVFFTLMILGLASSLPAALYHGLTAQGVGVRTAARVSHLPPWAVCSPPSWATTPCSTCSGPHSATYRSTPPPTSPAARSSPGSSRPRSAKG